MPHRAEGLTRTERRLGVYLPHRDHIGRGTTMRRSSALGIAIMLLGAIIPAPAAADC